VGPRTADPASLSAFRGRIEAFEGARLSPLATRSYAATRPVAEQDSPVRTPFQRDRDRIVHSKAFRRLKHKTQVFISPEGDHYRTRLTHTLETTGIARTVARAAGLNEDLTEAIGLGHDLGHPPFGHIGEEVLDACLHERYGLRFRHNHHSLRIVDELERLNLTNEVRDGILRHTWTEPDPGTPEGRIVRLVDRIAYINHDIDDAVRAGVLRREDLPRAELDVLGQTGSTRIDTLVRDVVSRFEASGEISQGPEAAAAMDGLRTFMFENVYLGEAAKREHPRIERMIRLLFDHFATQPPPAMTPDSVDHDRIVDWLAGMTDRYAIRVFSDLAVPQGF
jgi:dGTPase